MAQKRFLLGALVMALALALGGCNGLLSDLGNNSSTEYNNESTDPGNSSKDSSNDSTDSGNGSSNSNIDSALNGTWVHTLSDGSIEEHKFDNGIKEFFVGGSPFLMGSYSAGDGKITQVYTAINGALLKNSGYSVLEQKWYTVNELKTTLNMSDGDFEKEFRGFSERVYSYSIIGDTLTMIPDEDFGGNIIATRKGSTSSGIDSALNGTWVIGSGENLTETKFDNGNLEMSFGGSPGSKGVYSASGGKLTTEITAFYGDYLKIWDDDDIFSELESKWYSIDELRTALGLPEEVDWAILLDNGGGLKNSGVYSISDNTLTMTWEYGGKGIYTRK